MTLPPHEPAKLGITELLVRVRQGDEDALNELIPRVYQELKSLAHSQLRREFHHNAFETTALVHEAFLRLTGTDLPECQNRAHFFGIAARVMRQVLVDVARERRAAKRGGGLPEASLGDVPDLGARKDEAFLDLDAALQRLAAQSALKEKLIELRFFAGLTAEESADLLHLSVHAVRRELRLARAWLQNELS